MIEVWLTQVAGSTWAMPLLFALVTGDAFLVIVPGEAAVTAFGALAVSTGSPPLAAIVAVAALGAFCGDACCYLVGRRVGLDRWAWMRRPRVVRAFDWARSRLARRTASVVFTARFIPFARLAVNLTAGASHMPPRRYLPVVALAGIGWAAYQTLVGAAVAVLVPGGPLIGVLVSVAVALVIGLGVDAVVARTARRA